MFWITKAAFLLTSVFVAAFYHRLTKPKTLLLFLTLIAAPVFWTNITSPEKLIALGLITVLLILSSLLRQPLLSYLFTFLIVLTVIISVLFTNGILGNNFHWDSGRTVMVDAGYVSRITGLRQQALYLPYRFRPLIFGNWSIIIDLFGRSLKFFWFDNLWNSIGPIAIILLVSGILKKHNWPIWLIIFTGVLSAAVSRNPDLSAVFLFLSPLFFYLAADGLVPLK